jgi:DNA-binding transcriptional LysR family regulator
VRANPSRRSDRARVRVLKRPAVRLKLTCKRGALAQQESAHVFGRTASTLCHRVSHLGEVAAQCLRDSALVARKVGAISLQLYAAPSYLARKDTPKTPADLREHEWVGLEGVAPVQLSKARAKRAPNAPQRVLCNDVFVARELLRASAGIGMLPSFLVDDDVARGALVRVLPRWLEQTGNVYLVHPSRKHVPSKITAFRDLVIETLRQRPLSPVPTN